MKLNLIISSVRVNPDGSAYVTTGNVGDISGYYILKHYTDLPIYPINRNSPKQDEALVTVGSTLDLFNKLVPKGTVIGTGAIRDSLPGFRGDYDIRGVRGHLTAELIRTQTGQNVPVISDLGLLLPRVFSNLPKHESGHIRTQDVGFIIHSVDREAFFKRFPHLTVNLVNNYTAPDKFVEQLLQYKYIVSSSLHGLIFAHAYGIPCVGIKVTDRIIGGEFKYRDYYSSLNYDYPGRLDISKFSRPGINDWIDLVQGAWNPERESIQVIQQNQETVLKNYLAFIQHPTNTRVS